MKYKLSNYKKEIDFSKKHKMSFYQIKHNLVQLAGAVKYTNCISAEERDSSNECPGYDMK